MSLEDKMHLTSLMCSGVDAQLPEGDRSRARRRRRKARGEEEGGAKKRRLSDEQVKFLEINFGRERKLESGRKVYLATELGLDPKQVAVWFQNRRARWKSKQMEEEYLRLKSMHDAVVLEKCLLEAEVLKLKEQLAETKKGTNQVFVAGSSDDLSCGERSSSSPSSSFSVEAQQPLLGELGVERGAELMFMHEYCYYDDSVSIVDWPDFYGM